MMFIFTQFFGLLALVFVFCSYHFNCKKKFLLFQIIADILYSMAFFMGGILVGGVNNLVSLLRVIMLFVYERKGIRPSFFTYLIFVGLFSVSGIIFYESPVDIIAIICYQLFNIAMFVRDINLVRTLMIPPNIMICIYNILVGTYTNALLDFVEVCVLIVAVIKFSNFREMNKMKYLA